MSKLEDKLSASIKPTKGKPMPAAKAAPARKPPAAGTSAPASQDPTPLSVTQGQERPLHPRRVWPD